jgi:hypothetical protein
MDTPEILYHYTDAKGLHGILDSKEIWASSYRFMSDAREFEYGFELISEIYPENSPDSIFAQQINWKSFYDYDGLFVASFSAKDEGDSLGHWRGYAGLHSGYSLGFYREGLDSINSETRLIACCYDKHKQLKKLKVIIDKYLSIAKIKISSNDYEAFVAFVLRSSLGADAAMEVASLSASLKHPAFKEEQEWRLVVGPWPSNSKRICYRPGERVIIPYVKIGFKDAGLPLKHIIVGPGPHQKRNVSSLHQMLMEQEFKGVEVIPSKVPFRTW